MQIYLVGGAVRDQLLGREIKDKDWVVIGATPTQMQTAGYQQVGNDFPVFLHPETKEEYALARTERKSGNGYTGFVCEFSPDVTLEQDLIRRDLTINAMALADSGELIDPFNGKQDLDNRVLRHVSEAFVEDPLRVLRVARFAARYHEYGFSIAPETLALMTQICSSGELQHLAAERVWQETERSLQGNNPQEYFRVLQQVGGLDYWFIELANLWGVPNPPQHHPEIDSGIHTLMVLEQAALLSADKDVRFAALVHDLGKAATPSDKWPKHHGHDVLGVPLVESLCQRLKAPTKAKELGKLVSELHINLHRIFDLKPSTLLKQLNKIDVWRKPERLKQILLACKADVRGRTGFEQREYPQADYIYACYEAANQVNVQQLLAQGINGQEIKGAAIKEAINRERQARIAKVKQAWQEQR